MHGITSPLWTEFLEAIKQPRQIWGIPKCYGTGGIRIQPSTCLRVCSVTKTGSTKRSIFSQVSRNSQIAF